MKRLPMRRSLATVLLLLAATVVQAGVYPTGGPTTTNNNDSCDIALLPAWRGRGLGGRCLQALVDQGRALGIQVELHNPARRLYERLGFVADGAPQGLHQARVRPAQSASLSPEESLP